MTESDKKSSFKDQVKRAQEIYVASKLRRNDNDEQKIFAVSDDTKGMEFLLQENLKCMKKAKEQYQTHEARNTHNQEDESLSKILKEQTEAIKNLTVNQNRQER